MIDYISAIVLAFASAWLIRLAGLRSFERLVDAIAQLVGGWRPDPWPHGVQEENRELPWGRTLRAKTAERVTRVASVPLNRVRPKVRAT